MTTGQLVAFRMLAGRVSQPILRMVQMWQEFQQVSVSIKRLGEIFDVRPEAENRGNQSELPRLCGDIIFEGVRFRYIPEYGKIRIDGIDLATVDPAWIRGQIGIVMQENYLFHASVRENIALKNPAVPMNEIIRVAKLAGAHEFITELSEGYDTMIGERGTGLSGGQRQRIAIARALLTNPRILIFDEATSALDYESECVIQKNMRKICQGRTVIIIAHRLSTLKDADGIMVVEQGKVAEYGSMQVLLHKKGIFYHMLERQGMIV